LERDGSGEQAAGRRLGAKIMKIITFNANGIRAAAKKGFFDWFAQQDADVICIQETKAQEHQLQDSLFRPVGYHCYYHDATSKKGYSGVALYSKQKPEQVMTGLGWSIADEEGRYIQADFGKLSVASLYLPSGTSGPHRQAVKYDFLDQLEKVLKAFNRSKRQYILCGDWNIAHQQIDLKNWRANQKNSGFLPEERAWMDNLFGHLNYVDAFREVDKNPDRYTWWSNRSKIARVNNVGWRIDYQIISQGLKGMVKRADIYTEQVFSDHAPLIIDYEIL